MPSLPSWPTGPVCLIGDVAHATLPRAGQGASLAMEDAVGLAGCLRDVPDREADFAAFERYRKGRVEKLVEEARRNRDRKPYQQRSPAGSATWCCRSSSRWASRTPEKPTPTPWTGMRR